MTLWEATDPLNEVENTLGWASFGTSLIGSYLTGTSTINGSTGEIVLDVGVLESFASAGLGAVTPPGIDELVNIAQVGYDLLSWQTGSPGQLHFLPPQEPQTAYRVPQAAYQFSGITHNDSFWNDSPSLLALAGNLAVRGVNVLFMLGGGGPHLQNPFSVTDP